MLLNHLPCPIVIFDRSDHELDLIAEAEVPNILPAHISSFTAAWAFQIHNAMNTPVYMGNVMGTAGLKQHRKTVIAETFQQQHGVLLQQRFAPVNSIRVSWPWKVPLAVGKAPRYEWLRQMTCCLRGPLDKVARYPVHFRAHSSIVRFFPPVNA
jgi:hypothetical protein